MCTLVYILLRGQERVVYKGGDEKQALLTLESHPQTTFPDTPRPYNQITFVDH